MPTMKRLPANFTEDPSESVMSNFDHSIQEHVATAIKDQPLYSAYVGWNFCGKVWWQDDQWHCEIWTYGSYRQTISGDTLQEIMDEVSSEYGQD